VICFWIILTWVVYQNKKSFESNPKIYWYILYISNQRVQSIFKSSTCLQIKTASTIK